MGIILGALFFGLAGYVGVLLAGTLRFERFEDGPKESEPPIPLILGGSAIVGAILTYHAVPTLQIVLLAVVICALAAIWCTDVRYGIVPDAFTLVPLGLILLLGALQQNPGLFVSAGLPLIPFGIAAAVSKGRGMGWGDVKLAALGGAVLGAPIALVAFSISCLVAVIYSYLRGRKSEPIAFAPYLVAAIGAAIPLAVPA